MARNTKKKQPEAHKIDCAEVFASLRELEKLKGIPVDYMVERMKQGMANAYRKDREDRRDVPADNVVVDLTENGLSVHVVKTCVEELEDTALEILIDAARQINLRIQPLLTLAKGLCPCGNTFIRQTAQTLPAVYQFSGGVRIQLPHQGIRTLMNAG